MIASLDCLPLRLCQPHTLPRLNHSNPTLTHHGPDQQVGLAVKTVLDNVEEGWEDGDVPVADDNSSLFLETLRETAAGGGGSGGDSPSAATRPEASSGGGFSVAGGGRRAKGAADAGEVKQVRWQGCGVWAARCCSCPTP